ncbi:MAG: hypothetical protein NVS2B7_07360 [Herpetosiphon sp.]
MVVVSFGTTIGGTVLCVLAPGINCPHAVRIATIPNPTLYQAIWCLTITVHTSPNVPTLLCRARFTGIVDLLAFQCFAASIVAFRLRHTI